jgi:hypothetical protein
MTFADLLTCQGFQEEADNARSFAINGCTWYPSWIATSHSLAVAISNAADRLHRPLREVRDVAAVALVDIYHAELRRQARIARGEPEPLPAFVPPLPSNRGWRKPAKAKPAAVATEADEATGAEPLFAKTKTRKRRGRA